MACSVVGQIYPKERVIKGDVKAGNAIVIIKSSGMHANGASHVRRLVAERLPDGYRTRLDTDRTIGEALMTATTSYVPLVQTLLDEEVRLNFCVNVTGHAWAKFMRPELPFHYVIDQVPEPQPEFLLLQEAAGLSDHEMAKIYNMGIGFAFYCDPSEADAIVSIAQRLGLEATVAGEVRPSLDGRRHVTVVPKGLEYGEEDLDI